MVDAGAKGFVLFIEGIIEFIQARNIRKLIQSKPKAVMALEVDNHIDEHVNFRYCTEAMLENTSFDTKTLSEMLLKHGDSVVVAGSEKMRRIHLHTNHPADLFYQLKDYGTISFQKADDMIRQSEVVYKRKWKIGLVTDSTCDLSPELIDKYQIQMLPINISIGDNHYLDKITIQPDQFYSQLSLSGSFPKTSQINEKAFVNVYSHLASHYDSVIAIHLTDKFSGTFFNSYKAGQSIANEFNKPISVINSKNLSGALGLIVLRTAQAIEAGLPHAEIVKMTEKWIENSRIFVSVRTLKYMVRGGRVSYLKYMVKGGRVSATKGFISNLLNVNPIVSMDKDGKSQVFDKAYSQKANMAKVMKHVKNITKNRRIWNYVVLHAHNLDAADWFTQEMKNFTGKEPVSVVNISPVIGLNAGIGTASVAFMFD